MKDIKRFIISLSLFLPFLSLVYFLFVIIGANAPSSYLKPNIHYYVGSYGHIYSRIKDIKNYNNIDLLFLGSSHAYRGFDTRIFEQSGLSSFNLGSSSQTPIQTEVLLYRYLDSLAPRSIIIEVSPTLFMSDGIESSLDIMANDKLDKYLVTKLIKWDNAKMVNSFIYACSQNLTNSNYQEAVVKGNDIYIPGGFVEKKLSYYKPENQDEQTLNLKPSQVEAFNRIIKLLKQKDIPFLLIQAPISKSLYKSYSNIQPFDSLMNKQGRYYNYNKNSTFIDTIHFFDSHHLNQNGVKLFNQNVIEIFLENFVSTDSLP